MTRHNQILIAHGRPSVRRLRGWTGLWRVLLTGMMAAATWLAPASPLALAQADPPQPSADAIRVLVADANGISLALDVPAIIVAVVRGADGRSYTQLSLADFELTGTAGRPNLPARSLLLAVPAGAQLSLDIEILAERTVRLAAPVVPAPAYAASLPAGSSPADDAMPVGVVEQFSLDPAAYASMSLEPAAPAVLEDAGYLRDVHLARLTVYPLQYRAAIGELRHIRSMRLQIRFGGVRAAAAAPDTSLDVGGFADLARGVVANPEQVAIWRTASDRRAAAASVAAPIGAPASQPRYRITLRETGIYRLTYADLAAGGVPVETVDPRRLSLFRGTQELAIEIAGEGDGRFDPGDEIRFYAEQVQSLYVDVNTLWLVVGEGPGQRMTQRSVAPLGAAQATSFPSVQRFEENKIYRSAMPMQSDVDHWYWGQMFALNQTTVPTLTVPFTIAHVLPSGAATMALRLWGGSADSRVAPDHHLRVSVNDTAIGDVRWDGAVPALGTLTFDQALLHSGQNTLSLHTPGDTGARDTAGRLWEANWLDAFEVTYNRALRAAEDRLSLTPAIGPSEFAVAGFTAPDIRAYEISTPTAPAQLTGLRIEGAAGDYTATFADLAAGSRRYMLVGTGGLLKPLAITLDAPSDLRAPAEGADYLIIAHADFVAGVAPLAQYHRAEGLRVRVIDVQDIYDEFNAGLLDPHAIRDFIGYAYANWPGTPPAYVLLVGDGTYDFMNREGYNAKTFIPPFLANVDPVLGETATDNQYVAVVGDDLMPDLHLGRLPVNDLTELAAMVDKIIAYGTAPAPGAWRSRAVFVADNPDTGGSFGELSDIALSYLPPEFSLERIYLGTAEYPASQALRAQQATLNAFNSGALLFNYVGHSSIGNWAAELLFGLNALPQVSNGRAYPVILPMTCLEGTFHNPRFIGAGESVVRLANRGAVASWSPTGLGVATGHDYLHRGFYDALFNRDVRALGPATTAAKLNLFVNARFPDGSLRYQDLLATYVLLGDPATRIAAPEADLAISATATAGPIVSGDTVTYAVTYRNAGQARVKGVEIEALLPAGLASLQWTSSDPALAARPGSTLAWDLAELPPGASGQITMTARIDGDVLGSSLSLATQIAIRSSWQDADLSNNTTGPLVTTLAAADLFLSQVVEPRRPVAPGDLVTLTLSYANLGPSPARAVSLMLPLPVPLDDLQVTQTGPAAALQSGSRYAWNIPLLQAGGKGRVVISGRVPLNLTIDQLSWEITGRISAAWPDNDLSNNASGTETLIVLTGDTLEPDNTPAQAHRVVVPLTRLTATIDPVADRDWVVFKPQAGMTYLIRTFDIDAGGDTVLSLWDADGKLVAKNDDAAPDSSASEIIWRAPSDGDYYVLVTSYQQTVGFNYSLQILPLPGRAYLPLVSQPDPKLARLNFIGR